MKNVFEPKEFKKQINRIFKFNQRVKFGGKK